jgi:hypothetical protein
MRRMVIVGFCFLGLGLLVWLLRSRPGRLGEGMVGDSFEPTATADVHSAAPNGDAADAVVLNLGHAAREASAQHSGLDSVEGQDELLMELSRIRAGVTERVTRRPLLAMAQERRLPYFQLLHMSKPELFEAVLEAEGVPAWDVRPSPEHAERLRALASEALRREREVGMDDSAASVAG